MCNVLVYSGSIFCDKSENSDDNSLVLASRFVMASCRLLSTTFTSLCCTISIVSADDVVEVEAVADEDGTCLDAAGAGDNVDKTISVLLLWFFV